MLNRVVVPVQMVEESQQDAFDLIFEFLNELKNNPPISEKEDSEKKATIEHLHATLSCTDLEGEEPEDDGKLYLFF